MPPIPSAVEYVINPLKGSIVEAQYASKGTACCKRVATSLSRVISSSPEKHSRLISLKTRSSKAALGLIALLRLRMRADASQNGITGNFTPPSNTKTTDFWNRQLPEMGLT